MAAACSANHIPGRIATGAVVGEGQFGRNIGCLPNTRVARVDVLPPECRQAHRQLAVRQDDWGVIAIMVGAGSSGLSNEKRVGIQLHAVDTVHGRRKGRTPDPDEAFFL
jgi:hypothetical protein